MSYPFGSSGDRLHQRSSGEVKITASGGTHFLSEGHVVIDYDYMVTLDYQMIHINPY